MGELSRKEFFLFAPTNGRVINISEVPDKIFSHKMAGDGVGIESTGEIVVAPWSGIVSVIFNSNHAFGMLLENGAEILVHVGIDTIELQGSGFERMVMEGCKVNAGDPVLKLNRMYIEEEGYSLVTIMVITNMEKMDKICYYNLNHMVTAGQDKVIIYKIK